MKIYLFQSCGHGWVFQICWHIDSSPFTASSFRIWNSSTGIPSPPLALFIGILLKSQLTLHSRMSGCKWVITPSWLSGSWWSFLYNSSVYSCYLFLISSVSVKSIPFLSFIVPIFLKYYLGVSNFHEEISSLSRSIVFLYFFVLITEEAFLIFLCYSLELCIQKGISFLFFFAFNFSSFLSYLWGFLRQTFCLFLWMVLITVSCTMSWTYIHHSSGNLPIWSNPLNLFATSPK